MICSYHKLLLDLAQTLETRLEFQVVVRRGLGDCGYDCDVVTLGAHVVCRRDTGNVDV